MTEDAEDARLIAGRYRLIAEIGSGGMGVVWRAKDGVLGRTVAVKALARASLLSSSKDDEAARRAMREARIAASLHHPNVISVYDVVEHEGRPFLVMEYLESRSLSQVLSDGETLSPGETARIGAQVAAALVAAHKAGIVHRDVKPGNVLRAADGTVKITDFGISRAVGDTTVTASGVLLGTVSYCAPEVAKGQAADARSDVYSLGATLYAMLEGEPPSGTDDNAIATLYRIAHEDARPARNAGPLNPVLLWALERDPQLRPTMAQVQRALEEIGDGRGEQAEATTTDLTAPAVVDAEPETVGKADATPVQAPTPEPVVKKRPASLSRLSGRRTAIVSTVAVALLLGVTVALLLQGGGHPAASNAGTATVSHSASATHSAAATTPASQVTSTAAAPPASASASAPASASATSSKSLADQLTSTIIDYYKLMPGNLDQGWNWMTADYQQNHAGGRTGYASFWSQYQSVSLSDVVAQPPATVIATIHYTGKDGSTVVERTSFGLVNQQGQWKIASSSVVG